MVVFIILFKNSKGVIENSNSKNRQYNDQTKKEKKKNNIKIKINIVDKNITPKTKDWATYVSISLFPKNYCIYICTEIHENIEIVDKKDARSDK